MKVKKNWKNFTDQELVDSYLKLQDKDIFEEIYHRYKDIIFTYIRRFLYCSSEDVVNELVNEVFIKIYLKLPYLKDLTIFKNWIYRIAHNQCVDFIRANKMQFVHDNTYLYLKEDSRINIEKDYYNQELNKLLLIKIEALEHDVREMIILKFFQCLTYQEISEIMDINVATIKYKVKKALLELRAKLEKDDIY